jgi:adenylate kinase family enzyme
VLVDGVMVASVPSRVVVAGTTGSGKTTVAMEIAAITGAPHVELDALYWGPAWSAADVDVFRRRVAEATAGDRWVVDGGYASIVHDLVWRRAELFVWLDYAFPVVMFQLLRRTAVRWVRREELWSGNREILRKHFMSRDSLFLWAAKAHFKYRTSYPAYFAEPELAHLRVVRLRRPRDTDRFLRELGRIHHRGTEGTESEL